MNPLTPSPPDDRTDDPTATARRVLAHGSKSFALAGRLLPAGLRDDAAVLYAWCRHADDLVDLKPAGEGAAAVAQLRRELDDVYAPRRPDDPALAALQEVVIRRGVPREYPEELLAGMAMDAGPGPIVYDTLGELSLYCYRVAGVVGLMMCHVLGVRDRRAFRHAAHLGMAMQLTNICRDVQEDWERGRVYLPSELLGGRRMPTGAHGPRPAAADFAGALTHLLKLADRLYASGDAGLRYLGLGPAIAIRTARLCYAAIGTDLAKAGYDVWAGRVVIPFWRKLWYAIGAVVSVPLGRLMRLLVRPSQPAASLDVPTHALTISDV